MSQDIRRVQKAQGADLSQPTVAPPGCITCKTKRLKCDESKPTCLQCGRRKVQCGGYKRDFKWRPFEETNAATKTTVKAKNHNGKGIHFPGIIKNQRDLPVNEPLTSVVIVVSQPAAASAAHAKQETKEDKRSDHHYHHHRQHRPSSQV